MKLNEQQIEFLITTIFTSRSDSPALDKIARQLLTTGTCIVAVDGKLWSGGVGNFIRGEPAPGAVGCALLKLDLEGLLLAQWVRDYIALNIEDTRNRAAELTAQAEALTALLRPRFAVIVIGVDGVERRVHEGDCGADAEAIYEEHRLQHREVLLLEKGKVIRKRAA